MPQSLCNLHKFSGFLTIRCMLGMTGRVFSTYPCDQLFGQQDLIFAQTKSKTIVFVQCPEFSSFSLQTRDRYYKTDFCARCTLNRPESLK